MSEKFASWTKYSKQTYKLKCGLSAKWAFIERKAEMTFSFIYLVMKVFFLNQINKVYTFYKI